MTSHDDLLKRALRLLPYYRGRIWWITSRVVVLTVIVSALGLALSPKYVARTKLTLLPTRGEIGYAAQRPEALGLSPATLLGQTHAEALLSRSLAEEVARQLQTSSEPFNGYEGLLGMIHNWIVKPVTESVNRILTILNTGRWRTADPVVGLAQTIQSRTRGRNVPGSFVFEVAVTWHNPATASRIANLLTERYVQMTLRASQEEMRTTREYIEARIKEVETRLETLQTTIKDYRSTERLFSMAYNTSGDADLGLQDLSQYMRSLNAARADWQQLNTRIDALKAYQTPAALAAVEAERSGLKARQEALEKVVEGQIAKMDKLPAKEAGLLDLYRNRMILERALTGLQDRLLDTKVAEAAQLSAGRVIDPAIAPLYPERPLLLRNAVASVVVGVLLSFGFVLLAEARRAGLRSREDLGSESNALLGVVPAVAAAADRNPDDEKGGKMAEFFRGIVHGRLGTVAHRRTVKRHLEHLFLRLADDARARVCLFVSLNGGEGKTFLIQQLARLAGEAGRKVLLIDANLNHPALHLALGKPLAAGFAELLSGNAKAQDLVVAVNESVDLIGAGKASINGQGRWDLPACKEQLNGLAAGYDLVLVDSAALRRNPSVRRLLSLADRVVCVFDATASARDDLEAVQGFLCNTATPAHFGLNKVLCEADYMFLGGSASDRDRAKTGAAAAHASL
jgi:tyrosine-protein kinase Etk/Wzc